MNISDNVLQSSEIINFRLKELYHSRGYRPYRMSKFEEYDFYANNKDFLVSDNVITFTDTNGKLMALKPDVTLSIIKNSRDMPDEKQRVYYCENVYRVARNTGSFKEITQTGLECFGDVNGDDVADVLLLAVESLKTLSDRSVLAISNLSLIENAVSAIGISEEQRERVYKAIGDKNLHEISTVCDGSGVGETETEFLKALVSVHGGIDEVISELNALYPHDEPRGELERFYRILNKLKDSGNSDMVQVDMSVIDDINYYNGIVFKGYINGVSSAVLSGGQYDKLLEKMLRRSKAVGFAVYTDMLERIDLSDEDGNDGADDDYLNIALPKGRLGERVYAMFEKAGCECPELLDDTRKLIFENKEKKLRYFWAKPSDVGSYVERGAADIGVEGKDTLLENGSDVFELLDLKTGKCKMAVAAPKGFVDDTAKTLRVATKYPEIAQSYYRSIGRDIDIIHLNGSIEIAPIINLSDVIVDIVETGTTLKENDLEVIDTVAPISARVIANKAGFRFKGERIESIVRSLAKQTEEKDD